MRTWRWYQEWNRALFLHWRIPKDILKPFIPEGLEIETREGSAWVSVVPFTLEKIRPRGLPSISMLSDFYEVNFRTYVTDGTKSGVYFLSIQAQKLISALLSRAISGLPYQKAEISRTHTGNHEHYSLLNRKTKIFLELDYVIGQPITQKSDVDRFLTEQYCLHLQQGERLFRYDIAHDEWPLNHLHIDRLDHNYSLGEHTLTNRPPDLCHYSTGVSVRAWPRMETTPPATRSK